MGSSNSSFSRVLDVDIENIKNTECLLTILPYNKVQHYRHDNSSNSRRQSCGYEEISYPYIEINRLDLFQQVGGRQSHAWDFGISFRINAPETDCENIPMYLRREDCKEEAQLNNTNLMRIPLNNYSQIDNAIVIIEDLEFKWGSRDINVGLWPFHKERKVPTCTVNKLTFKFTWDHKNIWRRGERWSLTFYTEEGEKLESIVNKDFAAPFRHVSKYPIINEGGKGVSECEMAKQEIVKRDTNDTTFIWDFD